MSSSNLVANSTPSDLAVASTGVPDFVGLVRFLVEPFLDSPDALSVDCELMPARKRAWLRIAFDNEDKGRVFGRGGRNIQAIRTVLDAAAVFAGFSVHLDIYGETSSSPSGSSRERDGESSHGGSSQGRGGRRRPPRRSEGRPPRS